MPPIRDLIDIPEQVHRDDSVLRLAEGVARPAETLRTYVVTPQLVGAFDRALDLIRGAIASGSKGEPQNLRTWRVSEGFFDILGVPAHGRTFTADEHQPGADGAVVLSQGFWQQRFGGDPGVVGRTLTLSERPYVVVGVMPQQFDYAPGTRFVDVACVHRGRSARAAALGS